MLKLLFDRKLRKLPLRFKIFVLRYALSTHNSKVPDRLDGKKVLSIHLPPYPSEAFDTFLKAQLKASEGEPVPEIVNISLTTECKNDCWHCVTRNEEGVLEKEVLLSTIKRLKELGTFQFLFTGGNPLLRDDLEELVRAASGSSISLISSPGFISDERAKSLKKAGCQGVFVGLEHHEKKKNDELMGFDGAYERSLKTIRNVKKAGMLTSTWVVVTSDMIEELDDYLKFVRSKGVTDVAIFEPIIGPRDEILEPYEREYLMNVQKEKNPDYPRIISGPFMDSSRFMGCTAGYNRMHISAQGDVYPCDMLRETWGNIYEQDIEKIWSEMNQEYSEPICGCLALDNTEEKLPAYFNKLIKDPEK